MPCSIRTHQLDLILEAKYQQLHKVESGELKLEELADYVYTEKDMNTLIDTFQIRKREENVKGDVNLQNIKVRDLPSFLQNKLTPEDLQ